MPSRPETPAILRLFAPSRLRYVAPAAVTLLLVMGLAFSVVEGGGVSAWDGVWWVVSTVTTVGYGDVIPHTTAGRVIAIAVMVFGIGFLFLITGAIVEHFITAEVRRDVSGIAEPEHEILRQLERLDQRIADLESEVRAARDSGRSDR